jgi:hypothetical protein
VAVTSMSAPASRGADVGSNVRSLAGSLLLLDESPPPPPPPSTQQSPQQPEIDPLPRITEVTFGILSGDGAQLRWSRYPLPFWDLGLRWAAALR